MLDKNSCTACTKDTPPFDEKSAKLMLEQILPRELLDKNKKIQRNFTFKNFVEALAFANKIGEISESEFHHPDITIGWGYCQVVFYTHKINGLHHNDFVMATKANSIYES